MDDTDRAAVVDAMVKAYIGSEGALSDSVEASLDAALGLRRPDGGPYLIDARRLVRIGHVCSVPASDTLVVRREGPMPAHNEPVFVLSPLDGEPE